MKKLKIVFLFLGLVFIRNFILNAYYGEFDINNLSQVTFGYEMRTNFSTDRTYVSLENGNTDTYHYYKKSASSSQVYRQVHTYVNGRCECGKTESSITSNVCSHNLVTEYKTIESASKHIAVTECTKCMYRFEREQSHNVGAKSWTSWKNGNSELYHYYTKCLECSQTFQQEHTYINGKCECGKTENESKTNDSVVEKGVKVVGATLANGGIALVKGAGQFAEAIVDSLAMAVGNDLKSVTTIIDGVTYLVANVTDNTENWESLSASLEKKIMEFVSVDAIENAYQWFYDTGAGEWLDENAWGPLQSDGDGTKVLSQTGYYAPVVLASALSGGTLAPVLAGVAGFGTKAEDSWAKAQTKYENELQELYKNGEITKEEMESMKDEWANTETYLKGVVSATVSGTYEAFSYSKIVDKNVITAGGAAGMQTPVNNLIDVINGDRSLEELLTVEDIPTMIVDAVLGAASSSAGKSSNKAASKKNNASKESVVKKIDGEMAEDWEGIDELLDNYNFSNGIKEQMHGKIDKISRTQEGTVKNVLNVAEQKGQMSVGDKGDILMGLEEYTTNLQKKTEHQTFVKNINVNGNIDKEIKKELSDKYGEVFDAYMSTRNKIMAKESAIGVVITGGKLVGVEVAGDIIDKLMESN